MEPRPWQPRRQDGRAVQTHNTTTFNGAAGTATADLQAVQQGIVATTCFNGAAVNRRYFFPNVPPLLSSVSV